MYMYNVMRYLITNKNIVGVYVQLLELPIHVAKQQWKHAHTCSCIVHMIRTVLHVAVYMYFCLYLYMCTLTCVSNYNTPKVI